MPVKAVFFDIGGVLELTPATGWQDRWAARLDCERASFERCLARIWGPGSTGRSTLEEIERQTAEALSLDGPTLKHLMEDAWTEYLGTLNSELAAFFRSLRPRYRTGIISNSFVGAREREQAAYGFEDMCDVVVYSHEEGHMKPDARIYHLACERLEVPPAESLFLDDVPAYVEGAEEVGMRAVRFMNTTQAIEEVTRRLSE
ncbi:MAG TPA: HAD family phosphatase [Solirubrobacteraceae bacterium]|jgi:putative hydrolase of the HAD superfamily|nr:HAD family phosphatase [Solirubrobacteraceae bacterium]